VSTHPTRRRTKIPQRFFTTAKSAGQKIQQSKIMPVSVHQNRILMRMSIGEEEELQLD
jgi:hypothetical protein